MQILLWHNFFFIKNHVKITTQFMTTNLISAYANPFSQSTCMVSKNCPFFPKSLTEETAPNIWVSNYEISDGVNPFSSHIHTPHVIYTIEQSIQKIIIFAKFSKGFTPSYGHIMKR